MGLVPDEGKSLPPPGVVNRNSVWLAGVGWCSAMLQNAINHRPPMKSGFKLDSNSGFVQKSTIKLYEYGVHRQFLLATIGWFIGYHLTKYENYAYAKLDRDMNEYIKLHPEEFAPKEKRTFAEIVEPFHPVR